MNSVMLGMLAETPIHPGTGRSLGVVDLPVAREAATDYPMIPSSGFKGALRDLAERLPAGENGPDVDRTFGSPGRAGELLVSDVRLLLLPVRSLTGAYRWATCPHLLERFARDLRRCGLEPGFAIPRVEEQHVLAEGSGTLFLEERQFQVAGPVPEEIVTGLTGVIPDADARNRLRHRLAVLADDDFAWFVRYGLQVQARNVLEDGTKKSINLWYEETLPPDTVMYALLTGRNDGSLQVLDTLFPDRAGYIQAGGNETVGHGWFQVRRLGRDAEGGA